jgi:hypothetical protein
MAEDGTGTIAAAMKKHKNAGGITGRPLDLHGAHGNSSAATATGVAGIAA